MRVWRYKGGARGMGRTVRVKLESISIPMVSTVLSANVHSKELTY